MKLAAVARSLVRRWRLHHVVRSLRDRSADTGHGVTEPQNRATRQHRARSTVLLGFAAVVLAQGALALAVETIRPHWRDPEFFHRQQNLLKMAAWDARHGTRKPVVVVLGSSRPEMGLSPDHVCEGFGENAPLVFNCSQSGCQPVGQRINLARLLDAGMVPDFVLIEVFPPGLAHEEPLDYEIPISRIGVRDLARMSPYLGEHVRTYGRWLAARAASWHALRIDLLAHAGLAGWTKPEVREEFLWTDMKANGWGPFYPASWPTEVRERRLAIVREVCGKVLSNFWVNPHVAQAHRDLLDECRSRGIRSALFLMPESPAFRAIYPPVARAMIRDYLTKLSAEFGTPVFDGTAWIDDEAAFMDGHHLLGPAAEAFSTRLGRECVGPWLRGAG